MVSKEKYRNITYTIARVLQSVASSALLPCSAQRKMTYAISEGYIKDSIKTIYLGFNSHSIR
jgi:hypothetical protein